MQRSIADQEGYVCSQQPIGECSFRLRSNKSLILTICSGVDTLPGASNAGDVPLVGSRRKSFTQITATDFRVCKRVLYLLVVQERALWTSLCTDYNQ